MKNSFCITVLIVLSLLATQVMANEVHGSGSARTRATACAVAEESAASQCAHGVERYERCECREPRDVLGRRDAHGRWECTVDAHCEHHHDSASVNPREAGKPELAREIRDSR